MSMVGTSTARNDGSGSAVNEHGTAQVGLLRQVILALMVGV